MPNELFSLTLDGELLKKKLKELGPAALQAAAASLYGSAEQVMTISKETYVPVLTGALRSTGHVELPEIKDDSVSVVLGYGGPAAPYAIYVHENAEAHHPHGQYKYLETPLKEAVPQIENKLAEDLNAKFKGI